MLLLCRVAKMQAMQSFSGAMTARPTIGCRKFGGAAARSRPMVIVSGLATEKENPFAEELKVGSECPASELHHHLLLRKLMHAPC